MGPWCLKFRGCRRATTGVSARVLPMLAEAAVRKGGGMDRKDIP